MHSNTFTFLVKKEAIQIIHYNDCNHIVLFYKSLMLCYDHKGFFEFGKFLSDIDFDRYSVPFPDGSERMLINTYLADVKFSFSQDELNVLREAFTEASVLLEVNYIINN